MAPLLFTNWNEVYALFWVKSGPIVAYRDLTSELIVIQNRRIAVDEDQTSQTSVR